MKKELKGFILGVVVTSILMAGIPSFAEGGIVKSISVLVNSVSIKVNGSDVTADNFVYEGRTYVQVRNICELLGKDLSWDAETKTVNINDKSESSQVINYTNGDKYIGQLKDGIPEGNGKYIFANGDIYEGTFKDGKMEGKGTYTWLNGDIYVGDWVNGERTGYGIYTWPDKTKHEGNFVNGVREGFGTYTDKEGNKYSGEWKNDKENGKGVLIMADGTRYNVEFKDGQMLQPTESNNANLSSADTINYQDGSKYVGQVKNGVPDGFGKLIYSNGDIYTGNFTNGKVNGLGAIESADGTKFSGEWLDNKPNNGIYTDKDGKEYYVINGEITRNVQDYSKESFGVDGDITIKYPLKLFADDRKRTYLGKLVTNKFDSESIFNEFGTYGSEFSSNSIWNKFGTFGSEFSLYSPFNEFTSTPPLIIDGNGNIVGRLSLNKYVVGAISPYEIKLLLEKLNQ